MEILNADYIIQIVLASILCYTGVLELFNAFYLKKDNSHYLFSLLCLVASVYLFQSLYVNLEITNAEFIASEKIRFALLNVLLILITWLINSRYSLFNKSFLRYYSAAILLLIVINTFLKGGVMYTTTNEWLNNENYTLGRMISQNAVKGKGFWVVILLICIPYYSLVKANLKVFRIGYKRTAYLIGFLNVLGLVVVCNHFFNYQFNLGFACPFGLELLILLFMVFLLFTNDEKQSVAVEKSYKNKLKEEVRISTNELELTKGDLRLALQELETLFHNTVVGIFQVNEDGKIYRFNKVMEDLLKADETDIRDLSISDLLCSDKDIARFKKLYSDHLKNNEVVEQRFQICHKNSAPFWGNLSGKMLPKGTGDFSSIWVLSNVDRQVKMEELKDSTEHIMRHDLRVPLNTIIGYPEIILDEAENLNELQRSFLEKISAAGDRMLDQINNYLKISRIENGSYSPSVEQFNLLDSLEEVMVYLQELMTERDIKFSFSLEPEGEVEECMIESNESLLHSIFANLIKNAIESSPKGEEVKLKLLVADDYLIEIFNKGAIPKEIRPVFFEKYHTSGKKTGTGLGTYSAKLMSKVLKGDITFKTDDIQGTSLFVRLPKAFK